ncbi:MAG: ThuA domain-containing protein [Cyclobacteriaceae bacterium]
MRYFFGLLIATLIFSCSNTKQESAKLNALILDGSNNHYVWPKTSMMMKHYLEQTGLFDVEINRTDTVWLGIKYNPTRPVPIDGYIKAFPLDASPRVISRDTLATTDFNVDFSNYDLIVINLGAKSPYWPDETQQKFEDYMQTGGGLVVVHSADNAWGNWDEYNKMIGLGAWDRDSTTGPYAYINNQSQVVIDSSAGICGSHGLEHEYLVTVRTPQHPIMNGLPSEWLHNQDELYDRLRGPFENATILATAYSDVEKNKQSWEPVLNGTGWNTPTIMAIEYGQGRTFHTTMGHFDYSMECVGFITVLQRGAEWAATGNVTQAVPDDFPSKDKVSTRKFEKKEVQTPK